jgi:hypothetical protein
LFSTVLNLFFIPVLYVVVKTLLSKVKPAQQVEETNDVLRMA